MRLHLALTLAVPPLFALLAAAPAVAEEEATAAPSWTGGYVGATLGIGHLSTDQYSPPQLTYGGYPAASYDGWHPYAGVQAGLDLQLGATVLGLRLQHVVTGSDGDSFMKVDELISSLDLRVHPFARAGAGRVEPPILGATNPSV